jgi:hypothetical protein
MYRPTPWVADIHILELLSAAQIQIKENLLQMHANGPGKFK